MTRYLDEFLDCIKPEAILGDPHIAFSGIADYHTVKAWPKCLFVAIKKRNVDGHLLIAEALAQGAVGIVGEWTLQQVSNYINNIEGLSKPPVYIQVLDARKALAFLAAKWYGNPSKRFNLIGVTGTEGKTTTCYLIHSILNAAGIKSGLFTTIDVRIADDTLDDYPPNTTPEALYIQHFFSDMVDQGAETVVLETSSHGLAQYRVESCNYDIGVITNITRDHLDFHETLEAYRSAKAHLLDLVASSESGKQQRKVAVINADDNNYHYLVTYTKVDKIRFGINNPSDVRAENIVCEPVKSEFMLCLPEKQIPIKLLLPGLHNIYNCLAAVAVSLALSLPEQAIINGIQSLAQVPGRMLQVNLGQPFTVLVDFAHTPNALEQMLSILRKWVKGKIILVFGCPGERDKGKRSIMGSIGARLADHIIITTEDPRTEDVGVIMNEIAVGCDAEGAARNVQYWLISDREEAIQFAINLAKEGDIVLLAGKGHERKMHYNGYSLPWNEYEITKRALNSIGWSISSK